MKAGNSDMENSSSSTTHPQSSLSHDIQFSEADLVIHSKGKIAASKKRKAHQTNLPIKNRTLLGKAAISAENIKSEQDTKQQIAKIEKMNRSELLALAVEIDVDGSNLRKIYDTKLISEKGLKRALKAHFSDENIKQVLREEIIQENSFLNPVASINDDSLLVQLKSKFSNTRLIDAVIVSVITALVVILILKITNG